IAGEASEKKQSNASASQFPHITFRYEPIRQTLKAAEFTEVRSSRFAVRRSQRSYNKTANCELRTANLLLLFFGPMALFTKDAPATAPPRPQPPRADG